METQVVHAVQNCGTLKMNREGNQTRTFQKWQLPFLKLKDELKVAYDARLNLHHAILLSPNRTIEELKPAIERLEPCIAGGDLIHFVPVASEGLTHVHLFFGHDRSGLNFLSDKLQGLDYWLGKVPKGTLPEIKIPMLKSQSDINLARWASLVFWLAWECDTVYLNAEVEFRETADSGTFLPWADCPQPPLCDPRCMLVRQVDSRENVRKWTEDFQARGLHLPEVIDAFLPTTSETGERGELLYSSICAIDLLTYNLMGLGDVQTFAKGQNNLGRKTSRGKKKLREKIQREVDLLEIFLDQRREQTWDVPVTQKEIRATFGWFQSKVTRRLQKIYPGGVAEYKSTFIRRKPPKSDWSRKLPRTEDDESGESDRTNVDDE